MSSGTDPEGRERTERVVKRVKTWRCVGALARSVSCFVRDEFKRLGFVRVAASRKDADVTWIMRMPNNDFKELAPHQRVNFFPGTFHICRKDLLHRNTMAAIKRHGRTSHSWWPMGFTLPDQYDEFQAAWEDHEAITGTAPVYILKCPFSSNGAGVRLVTNWIDVGSPTDPILQKEKPLAQQYLTRPMLVDGYKFTLRVYVVVTGVDPLRAYVFNNGLVRLCSEKYTTDSFDDTFKHIDSFDINEHNEDAFVSSIADDVPNDGLRLDFNFIWPYIERTYGIAANVMWNRVVDAIRRSLTIGEASMTHHATKFVPFRTTAFDLFGYDVFIEEDGTVSIIEINHTPSMQPHTDLENKVKEHLIHDYFALVDMTSTHRFGLKAEVQQKWDHLLQVRQRMKPGEALCCHGLNITTLTRAELWTLCDVEREMQRCESTSFEPLFPCVDAHTIVPLMLPNKNVLHSEACKVEFHTNDILQL